MSTGKTLTINIFGGCVSRDAFGLHPNNGGYRIGAFIQDNNPVSAVAGSILPEPVDPDDPTLEKTFEGLSGFGKRMLSMDLNKTAFDYLAQHEADWIILDATACRYSLARIRNQETGESCPITYRKTEIINEILGRHWGGYTINKQDVTLFAKIPDDEFRAAMGRFLQSVLRLFDENRIILLECYPLPWALEGDQAHAFNYDAVGHYRRGMERGFEYFHEHLPLAHVIEFPQGVVSDTAHKWGADPLHYVPEYYDYALEAVDIIVRGNLPQEYEAHELTRLKKRSEALLRERYEPLIVKLLTQSCG